MSLLQSYFLDIPHSRVSRHAVLIRPTIRLLRSSGLDFPPKEHRTVTTRIPDPITVTPVMKRAFVIRLSPEARPVDGKFEGRVEEVDSGRNLKFSATKEFLEFLQQCLDSDPANED